MRSARGGLLVVAAAALLLALSVPAAFAYDTIGAAPWKSPGYDGGDCAGGCHANGRIGGPHGGYTSGTNECRVCHILHDANGVKLLFDTTVTDTCRACHDGTGSNMAVYQLSSLGVTVSSAHRTRTPTASVIPGGDAATGGSVTATFAGPGGYLGCNDCHSPHDNRTVAPFKGSGALGGNSYSFLLKQRPTGAVATVTAYGSDWCLACHKGRSSAGPVHNHPVDSLQSRADPFTFSNVLLTPVSYPVGIAVDATGQVFVSDAGNIVYKKFDSSGAFLGAYGKTGIYSATALTVESDGYIVWANYAGGQQSARWDAFGNYGGYVGPYPSGGTVYATAAGRDGYIWFLQRSSGGATTLLEYTNAGTTPVASYSAQISALKNPYSFAVAPNGKLWFADTLNDAVRSFDPTAGVMTTVGTGGTGPGQFSRPHAIAVAGDGSVCVADTGNSRVQKLDANGAFVAQWGGMGTGDGQFARAAGIAVGPDGSVYVLDAGNSRIEKFTAGGAFVTKWGSAGSGNSQFRWPNTTPVMGGIARTDSGYVMPDPRAAAQTGHGPICQQCHENVCTPGDAASGFVNEFGGVGAPAYTAFPHESQGPSLLVQTADALCLDCHSPANLP